jgi:hypothetical protein
MMEVIRPRDDAQRDAILPVVRATDERNRQIIQTAHAELRATLDSMRARLAPQLDAAQRARLEEFARMAPPPREMRGLDGRPGRPGMGPPGGRPRRDDWGPPPPRDGGGHPPPPAPGEPPRPQPGQPGG